ncbi:hypothetical protein [Luteipulveratus mongoliensis]|uniref:Uncharacterized protein n=1 Tax=Luteipulveratus mongoliensis TaxID=571913 RepID=A0A0K1JEA9_9MICO|nr:hypothetical protein [Luteipulveratus mongoliensis]AKU15041.1 hypothetical protein VV02_02830 [Luteipulveratus mongoliensis]
MTRKPDRRSRDDFDPQSVPVYPVGRMEIRPGADGRDESAWLDGYEVPIPHGSSAREVLIEAMAARAAARPGSIKALRVVGLDANGSELELVVTADGTVHDVSAQASDSDSMVVTRKMLLGVGAGLTVVATGLVGAIALTSRDAPPPQAAGTRTVTYTPPATPTPTQLPALAPPGWSDHAEWASPPITSARPDVAVTGRGESSVVWMVTGQPQRMTAVSGTNGHVLWSVALGDQVTAGPVATVVNGQPVVMVVTGNTLRAWPADGSKASAGQSWALPTGSRVTLTAGGPIVRLDGQHVGLVDGAQLVQRVLPAAATPVAVLPGARLVAALGGQVWTVTTNTTAPAPAQLVAPKGTSVGSVVYADAQRLVATLVKGADTQHVQLASFPLAGGPKRNPQWHTGLLPAISIDPQQGLPVGDGWGVYGTTAVPWATGKAVGLPRDWSTFAISGKLGWGRSGDRILTVTEKGLAGASRTPPGAPVATEGATTPVGPVAMADGLALIPAADGRTTRVYAVLPEDPSATAPPSTTAPPATAKPKASSTAPGKATKPAPSKTPAPPRPSTSGAGR